jgi:hypothetical protein
VYLLVLIRNLLVHLAEKILLMQPLTFGGDYRVARALLTHCIARAADEFIHRFETRAPFGAEAFYASAGFVALRKVDIALSTA